MGDQVREVLRSIPSLTMGGVARRLFSGIKRQDWGRVVMNMETKKLIEAISPQQRDALEISGKYWGRIVNFKTYKRVDYPDYDICAEPLGETFDLILAEQVFEHLLWPYRAVKNVYQMLNPGGYALLTVPFLVRIHDYPFDCSRWTELGLRYSLAEGGFPLENTKTGWWGNRACINANFKKWVTYRPYWQSLQNEANFPYVVWALARKSE